MKTALRVSPSKSASNAPMLPCTSAPPVTIETPFKIPAGVDAVAADADKNDSVQAIANSAFDIGLNDLFAAWIAQHFVRDNDKAGDFARL